MTKDIIFTNVLGFDFYPPKPAIRDIPEWYIETSEYVSDLGRKVYYSSEVDSQKNMTPHTIKKCMPVFDAMTAGYLLYTQVDVQVTQENYVPFYTWPSQNAIGFHPVDQAPIHPLNSEKQPFAKWNNPYAIKTPPGYSLLCISPMHNPNNIFTILPGIVDTDIYTTPINFPFILNNVKWEGIIEAGTPMAQVIPIKRDSWKLNIGSTKERNEQEMINSKLKTLLFNSYKKQFWSRKEYK